LEALCRLASIKALPFDEEVAAQGCTDAGQYRILMKSQVDTRLQYEKMLVERKVGWGGTTSQPLERCVSHLLWIMVRAIEEVVYKYAAKGGEESNGELSAQEINLWLKRKLKGEDKS
jgi:hypothetical protein